MTYEMGGRFRWEILPSSSGGQVMEVRHDCNRKVAEVLEGDAVLRMLCLRCKVKGDVHVAFSS